MATTWADFEEVAPPVSNDWKDFEAVPEPQHTESWNDFEPVAEPPTDKLPEMGGNAEPLSTLDLLGSGLEKVGAFAGNTALDPTGIGASLIGHPVFEAGKSPLPEKALSAFESSVRDIAAPPGAAASQPGSGPMTGIAKTARKVVEGGTTPGALATFPLLEFPAGRAAMTALMAAHTPEQIKQAYTVLSNDKSTPAAKWEALGDAGVNLAMTGALALHVGVEQFKAMHTPEEAADLSAKTSQEAQQPSQTPPPIPQPEAGATPQPAPVSKPIQTVGEAVGQKLDEIKALLAQQEKPNENAQSDISQTPNEGNQAQVQVAQEPLTTENFEAVPPEDVHGGAQENLSAEQQAISKANNAPAAWGDFAKAVEAQKEQTRPNARVISPRPIQEPYSDKYAVSLHVPAAELENFNAEDVTKSLPSELQSSVDNVRRYAGDNIPGRVELVFKDKASAQAALDYFKEPIVDQSVNNISEGPGAASPGDVPKASDLKQLTNVVEQTIPPDASMEQSVSLASRFNRASENTKERAGEVLAKGQAISNSIWNGLTKLKPIGDEKSAVGRWTYAVQKADHEARMFGKAIMKTVPDPLRREAITNWIQAQGDEAVLRARADASKPNVKPGYEAALNLTPEEKAIARQTSQYFESMLQKGVEAGILEHGIDNYISQVWKPGENNPVANQLRGDFTAAKLQPNFKFAKQRIFDSYFEGEQAGYKPKNKDVGYLVSIYDQAFNKSLAARGFLRDLHEGTASDGRPLVEVAGHGRVVEQTGSRSLEQPKTTLINPRATPEELWDYRKIDHPAMRGWKWVGSDGSGNSVLLKGDLLVHPEAYAKLKNRLSSSWWRTNPYARTFINAQTAAKQALLSFSGFHQVQETIHSIGHRVNPFDLEKIDFDDPHTKELVQGGLQISDYNAESTFAEGLSAGGFMNKIPLVGKHLLKPYTEYLFQDYIPRLKVTMGKDAFERNLSRYKSELDSGKITRQQLAELTANQANAAFGELNYKYMGRNPTLQDSLRAFLLAPDFLEARSRFVGQAVKPYGREQMAALGTIAALSYFTARVWNKMMDDDYHWGLEDAFAYIYKGKRYTLRTVPGDIVHLISDPRSFTFNRASLGSRIAIEGLTGRDDRGVKRDMVEQMKDAGKNLVPLSLHSRDDVTLWESFLRSVGLNVAHDTATMQVGKMAKNFMSSRKLPTPYEEIYKAEDDLVRPLRVALQNGDIDSAQKAYDALKSKMPSEKIQENIKRYFSKPFTGSIKNDTAFTHSLDAEGRQKFKDAQAERQDALNVMKRVRK